MPFRNQTEHAKYILEVLLGSTQCEFTRQAIEQIELDPHQIQGVIQTFEMVYQIIQEREVLEEQQKFHKLLSKARPGYVYVLLLSENLYKIGRAQDPFVRMMQIAKIIDQMMLPENRDFPIYPRMTGLIETHCAVWTERELHRRYAAYRDRELSKMSPLTRKLTTEIFRLSEQQAGELRAIKRLDPPWYTEYLEFVKRTGRR